ncbi:alpha/beta hydrolase-fold protein [Bacillus sp. FJAT-27251]|uniref:alpha/beta hydrolase n=1 Tax=Bacillus sp. FJAT-27251 TaxID=1684142 RepID=UPI0006A7C6F8|nr:alpha/beta hydrolase-fold protein [Bacillus sp. FJAT-27251]
MIETFIVPLFNKERQIRVYLPKSYSSTAMRYPVLYMHDGQNVFNNHDAIGGVSLDLHDYLDEHAVDLIVVAIDQNPEGEERIHEYCPWTNGEFSVKLLGYQSSAGGKGKAYIDFVVQQLKPLIDRNYRSKADASYMAGISLGGLISVYAACMYPQVFKRVAGISSGFYRNQEEIEKLAVQADLSLLERVYLDCGTNEGRHDEEISKLALESNRRVYDILKGKVEDTRFQVIDNGEHHYEAFKKRIPEVLVSLIGARGKASAVSTVTNRAD